MFGDLIFGFIVPYGFVEGKGEPPYDYANVWRDVCPAESDWENQSPDKIPSLPCGDK